MKLLKRLLHGLAGKSRQGERILSLLISGRSEEAIALARQSGGIAIRDWQQIAETTARTGPEAVPLLFLAIRRGGINYPLLLAGAHWLVENGEPLRAFVFLSAAHQLAPAESAPLLAQGEIHLTLGNFRAAATLFLAALQRDETSEQARTRLQEARQRAGLPPYRTVEPLSDSRESLLRTAVADTPDDPRAQLDYGRWLVENHRSTEALPLLETAHRLSGEATETGYWFAAAMTMLGRHEEAWDIATSASKKAPQHLDLLAMAAECAAMTGRETEAVERYQMLVAANPAAPANIWSNLGNGLARLERFSEAITPLEHAVALAPQDIAARLNLAYALYYAGHENLVDTHLDALLAIEKNDFEARWFRASLLLGQHRFAAGWQDYTFRTVQSNVAPRIMPFPLWQGQSLTGKKIIVAGEQGVGDQIMFLSCLRELMVQAGQVVVECEPRLARLFARSFPQAAVVPMSSASTTDWQGHDNADFHVPMGSLPRRFRPNPASFASAHVPYLIPDADAVNRLQARLAGLGTGPKIGIAWRGGMAQTRRLTRTLALDQLAPVLQLPGCQFISLQYGDCGKEIDDAKATLGITLHHWPDILADLDEFAALTSTLDLIVTVCSAPVHFAGALGKPAIALVPHTPEWRYAGLEEHMLWYPSVTLIQQPKPGDWSFVINKVVRRMASQLSTVAVNC